MSDAPQARRGDDGSARHPPMWLIYSVTVTAIAGNTLLLPAIPDILDHFDQPDSAAGLLVAAGALPGILMAPIIGLLADRFGRRPVLVPCLVVFGVGGALAGVATTWPMMIGARFLQGFGAAGLINLAVVILGDHWTGIERARRVGYNAAVLTVSIFVFPVMGGLLAEVGGWRWSFAPMPLALGSALAALLVLPSTRPETVSTLGGQISDAWTVVRQPLVFASIGFGFVLFVLVFGLFLTTMPVHLSKEFGLGPAARGFIVAAPAAGSTLAALRVGRLRARFGGRRLVIAATAMFAATFLLVGVTPWLWLLVVGTLCYGLAEGSSIPTVQDFVTGSAPDESRGAVVAVFVSSVRGGQTVGPLLAGAAMATVGTSATFLVAAAVAAVLLVVELLYHPEHAPAASTLAS